MKTGVRAISPGFDSCAFRMRNKDLNVSIDDIGGPITLGDLRWLVQQCMDLADDSEVDVRGSKSYNQFDRDPAVIEVRGKLKKE